MLNTYAQDTRHIQIDTVLPAAGFVVERFHGREGVSESFRFEIDVLSSEPFLDLSPLLGSAIRLRLGTSGDQRCWNGYATQAAYLDTDGELRRYRLTMESWLSLLHLRRNCLYFVDSDVRGICDQVFGDYVEAKHAYQVSEPLRVFERRGQYRETDFAFVMRQLASAGLSFRIEHAQDGGMAGTAPTGDHTVIIFDRRAAISEAGQADLNYHLEDAQVADGVVTLFTQRHQLVPDCVVAASWKSTELRALSGNARAAAEQDAAVLPERELFDGVRPDRFETDAQAQLYAEQRLDALRLAGHLHYGASTVRTLELGKAHRLTGYLDSDMDFVALSIEHEAANNLGADIAQLLSQGELDRGYYRNRFLAVPRDMAIVPLYRDMPIAAGVQTAIVLGEPDTRVSSTRDHQVRIQFGWMRGEAPLPGGLSDAASRSRPEGHAPGDHRSALVARIAEQAAGPNFGHSFTPRVGAEVVVGFPTGDIDHPVILGQVYGGSVRPPFAAGEGSDANHPGVLTGLQTQGLDGQMGSRWVMDDTPGQLRHELFTSVAASRIGLGYLIDQDGSVRGRYRGAGFELATDGWAMLRGAQGVLVSSTARPDATSSQMDVAEGVGQLQGAIEIAQRLDGAARQAQAGGLSGNPAQQAFLKTLDPAQDGKYTGSVAGQDARKPSAGQRSGGDPVERFGTPAVLLESPQSITLTTPHSAVASAGDHVHLTSRGDAHLGAGTALSAAAGGGVSLFSAAGGLKAVANHGPVTVQAHTGTLQVLADQSVTVTSTEDRIDVMAKDSIVLQQGPNRITLKSGDITVETPGMFKVKSATHTLLDGAFNPAKLAALPNSGMFTQHFQAVDADTGEPITPRRYELSGPDYVAGATDASGKTAIVSSDAADQAVLTLGLQEVVSLKEFKG
ncbi:type VI secretion system Vgr family protein [Xanthomonas oryzae]|uniref:type VI secretion system Vgr family protein n=1 Tax=Xanthomonas oryzae TaxID=347 RepID=UPI000B408C6B|nr:type VI secretion system Vgr family protein [Xanthomonas oryzae]OWB28825.1 type IV secretion protein Rhs [Xanthomonas oryzae pv. oryzicola]